MHAHAQELKALPAVAREAIRARLEERAPELPVRPHGALESPTPVFVTLKIDGELRGCIGELEAHQADLVAETADRARAAAFHDPRFPPLTLAELPHCAIDVTLLMPLEPVESEADLDPLRYGVEVTDSAGRRAVLLPAIEGIDDVETQLRVAKRKAGISDSAPVALRRFEALRIDEEPR